MKPYRILFIFIALATIISCSPPRDKQHYKLTDSNSLWHHYVDGEYLRYQFIGTNNLNGSAISGNWDSRWRTTTSFSNLPLPNTIPATLTTLTNTISPYSEAPRSTHYYVRQDDKGAMSLYGVQQETMDTPNFIENGVPFYGSPVSIVNGNEKSTTFKLMTCGNSTCGTLNGDGNISYKAVTIETVDTPYAIFDCYKISMEQYFSVGTLGLVKETIWVYPPLGIVKASIADLGAQKSYDAVSLVETNIAIPTTP